MARPTSRILDHCDNPRHAGPMENPSAVGRVDLNGRAPRVNLYIQVESDRLTSVSYETFGCGFMIACCSIMAETVHGYSFDHCKQFTSRELETLCGGLPENKKFCAELAVRALKAALLDLKGE
jgi:NifU-like protein involved in Fe-S cluster formation